jgi:hypothetical protein
MIGVAAQPTDLEIAEEFFEVFKTPWERVVRGRRYDAVLCTEGCVHDFDTPLCLIYSSQREAVDIAAGIGVEPLDGPLQVRWRELTLPIYQTAATFVSSGGAGVLTSAGKAVDYERRSEAKIVRRIGYDLFREVRCLLTNGQPASNASIPTLDLHVALLRSLLRESRVPFAEIPPRPYEYDFICCLTHDIDFYGLRRQGFDLTLAGFTARASFGTLADFVRGRRPFVEAVRNWVALLSLPLVFLGLARDFWRPFDDYASVEDGRHSTFFVVPFKQRPGVAPNGRVDPARAVPYQAEEIRSDIARAMSRGSELGVHGIDAWRDSDAGRAELEELDAAGGRRPAGIRMHWLYFTEDSPRQLEAAGFAYDSTWGYNDTVGYRAGTLQPFRFPGTRHLLELPLAIMDTALFYRHRMALETRDALQICRQIIAHAQCFGGAVVINWHERSLAPERLWGRAYRQLLDELRTGHRVWFATSSEAVDWFRWRRSIRFSRDADSETLTVTASAAPSAGTSALMRVHRAHAAAGHVDDIRLDGNAPLRLQL